MYLAEGVAVTTVYCRLSGVMFGGGGGAPEKGKKGIYEPKHSIKNKKKNFEVTMVFLFPGGGGAGVMPTYA